MQKRGSVFWDVLPLVLILAVAIGSLSNVDFTGMVVSCNDLDSDSYYECTGCDDVTEFPSLPSGTKSGLDIARDKIIYTRSSLEAKLKEKNEDTKKDNTTKGQE